MGSMSLSPVGTVMQAPLQIDHETFPPEALQVS